MSRKVCVVITARPSYSRIKTVLAAIKNHPNLELQVVVAASALLERYGEISNQIEKDGFSIAARVHMVLEGEDLISMAKTTGLGVVELSSVFENLRPDVVITVADRYETIATGIASSFLNIPLAHVQGGEITGSIDEKVRHAVTKLSDIHFVATEMAKENVLRMGENPEKVFVTGCPSIDLAIEALSNPSLDFDPIDKYGGVGSNIDLSDGYVVVMQHSVTTEYLASQSNISKTVRAIQELGIPALWFWPNVDPGSDGASKAIRIAREMDSIENIRFFKNMDSLDFLRLLYNSKCLIGNSSVGIRECSFLGVPVVNIGTRQFGRERGSNVLDVDYDENSILSSIQTQIDHGLYLKDKLYGEGNAGKRMAGILSETKLSIRKRLNY
tara:strand:- start:2154 stop:3308 length:1155 start_codon:yes stop_codon:yes gene_type:complete